MPISNAVPSRPRAKILLINPNSTATMTCAAASALIGAEKMSSARLDQFTAPLPAPAEITSFTTEVVSAAASIHPLLPLLPLYDGFLVACFSEHPLVEMLREHTDKPVVGIMEASLAHASLVGDRSGIVTTNKEWELLLTKSVRNMGFSHHCRAVKAIDISPASLECTGKDLMDMAISEAVNELVEKNGCDVIIMGCAGMSQLKSTVQQALTAIGAKVRVIDAVVAGYEILLGLITVHPSC